MLDTIPIELLSMILNRLSTADQIRCRLVSKKFRFVIENEVKVRRLIVSLNQKVCEGKWYRTYRRFDLNDLINAKHLDFLQTEPFRKMFSKLRMLYVYDFPEILPPCDLDSLNELRELEHLELWFLRIKNLSKLTLPNLKVFCVNEQTSARLIIDTNSLLHLKTVFELDLFTFNHASSIRSVQCNRLTPGILAFTNLEHLCCYLITQPLVSDLLPKLVHLKRLQFYDQETVYQSLVEQKRRLNRRDLKIFYLGINFEQRNGRNEELDLSAYNLAFSRYHLNAQNLPIYFDNYHRLDDRLPFVNCVDYSAFEDRFGLLENVPGDFFDRFPIINNVHVSRRIVEPESFRTFLTGCSSLHSLSLKNSHLEPAFFDRLPSVCSSIGALHIKADLDSFEFVLEFKNLLDLEIISESLSIDLVRKAFTTLKHLEAFTFTIDQTLIYVGHEEFGYEVDVTDRMSTYKNTLDDVIDFLNNKDYECF